MPAKRKKREVVEEEKFVKLVESHGWICYKLAMVGPFGKAGLNDRVVFAEYGVTALFEFKRADEDARALQDYMHRKLKRMKFQTHVVYSCDEAFAILSRLVERARTVSFCKKLADDSIQKARRIIRKRNKADL